MKIEKKSIDKIIRKAALASAKDQPKVPDAAKKLRKF